MDLATLTLLGNTGLYALVSFSMRRYVICCIIIITTIISTMKKITATATATMMMTTVTVTITIIVNMLCSVLCGVPCCGYVLSDIHLNYMWQGCASSPNDNLQQEKLRSAAEDVRLATNTAASNALKRRLVDRLEVRDSFTVCLVMEVMVCLQPMCTISVVIGVNNSYLSGHVVGACFLWISVCVCVYCLDYGFSVIVSVQYYLIMCVGVLAWIMVFLSLCLYDTIC